MQSCYCLVQVSSDYLGSAGVGVEPQPTLKHAEC